MLKGTLHLYEENENEGFGIEILLFWVNNYLRTSSIYFGICGFCRPNLLKFDCKMHKRGHIVDNISFVVFKTNPCRSELKVPKTGTVLWKPGKSLKIIPIKKWEFQNGYLMATLNYDIFSGSGVRYWGIFPYTIRNKINNNNITLNMNIVEN